MLTNEEISRSDQALWFGLFPADDESLSLLSEVATLDKRVEFPHVTFGYKIPVPDGIDWNETYWVDVIGYGNDGDNEGYQASFPGLLDEFYFGADVPHITLSTSNGGSPVDTAFIKFKAIREPFSIPMKFGYYCRGRYFV